MMTSFNNYMMALARDSRGLTQAGLARAMGITQATVSKIESGMKEPDKEFVTQLSEVLDYREEFFHEPGRPIGFPPFYFRKRKKLSIKKLNRINAEINIRRIHIQKLLESYDYSSMKTLPEIDRDEYLGSSKQRFSAENVSRHLREHWMLPNGPVANMVELLEHNGALIIPCDFNTSLIDAISQRIVGLPALIFINKNVPTDRLRHTLAHELGHMIMHTLTIDINEDEMEQEADEFAGAFLLPADEVKLQLQKLDIPTLAKLKMHWKVSIAALAVRADRLKLITPYQKKKFWMEMSRLGYRKEEPVKLKAEKPKLLSRIINHHIESLGYSYEDIAKLTHLTIEEFRKMYELGSSDDDTAPEDYRSHLRVIK